MTFDPEGVGTASNRTEMGSSVSRSTPVGVNAKIQNNKLNIVIELFSLDGKKRFYLKSSKKLKLAPLVGKELGEKIKKRSKNLYKKNK